jgi:hypothetical protein
VIMLGLDAAAKPLMSGKPVRHALRLIFALVSTKAPTGSFENVTAPRPGSE